MGQDNSDELLQDQKTPIESTIVSAKSTARSQNSQRIKTIDLDEPKLIAPLIFRSSDGNSNIASLRSSININTPLYE